jgi:phosphatidylserine synthase
MAAEMTRTFRGMSEAERTSRARLPSYPTVVSVVRRRVGPFGVKDLFTLINLVSGVIAVRFALADHLRRAGYTVIIGYLAGDLLDGLVARATNTGNRFGAEFDSVTDHFVHVMVPALILYQAYDDGGHAWLGLAAVGVLIATATIRHARLSVEQFNFPCWCGLPRTIAGFAALSFPLSRFFFADNPMRYWTGFAVVLVLSSLTLLPVPYQHHRTGHPLPVYAKFLVGLFIVTPVAFFAFDRSYAFDVFFFWIAGYAATGWFPVGREGRRRFYVEYRRWAAEIAR